MTDAPTASPSPRATDNLPDLSFAGIGIIAPYDFALDRELWRWAPPAANLHLTRLPWAAPEVTIDMVTSLGNPAELTAATRELTTVGPAVLAYACTSGSFVGGIDGEHALREVMKAAGAPAATTTSGCIAEALAHLDANAVAIATPYTRDITERLEAFLAAHGHTVVGVSDLGMQTEIWTLDYRTVADLVRRADQPNADAVVLSCTNVPSYDLIAPLEEELGKPIISANQATMWGALKAAGMSIVGPGQRLVEA